MRQNRIFECLIIFLLIILNCNNSKTINTNFKSVYENNKSTENEVTEYDLALLASLVYEDVPNDNNYEGATTNLNGCYNKSGVFNANGNCKYNFYSNKLYNREGYRVLKYVEGMSTRKMNAFTAITTTSIENGEMYYFLDYAKTSDAADWTVIDAVSKSTGGLIKKSAVFDAVTFKKGDNYVIAYRGTDFPDVLEWLQDLAYAFDDHAQADAAYEYAQHVYESYIKKNNNAKLYITGHSLGAYLAQVGGIAILDKEEKLIGNSKLYQVAYFNGMGITAIGLGAKGNYITNLQKLATQDRSGNTIEENNCVKTNDGKCSSGRLRLYRIKGDPVSEIGIHFGEIIQLSPALDSQLYHTGTHTLSQSFNDLFASQKEKMDDNISFEEALKNYLNEIENSKSILETNEDTLALIKNKLNSQHLLTKSLSNTIWALAKGNEVLSGDIYNFSINDKTDEESSLLNIRTQALKTTFKNGIKDVLSTIMNKGIKGTIESVNIAHETDSFLCLNNNNGKPEVDITANSNSIDNPISVISTTAVNNSATSRIYYKNLGTKFNIFVDARSGCARKYTWYKIEPSNNYGSEFVEFKEYIKGMTYEELRTDAMVKLTNLDANNKVEYSYTTNKDGNDEIVAVVVNYGNIKERLQIDEATYKVVDKENSNDNTVIQIIEIKRDTTPPVCTENSQGKLIVGLTTEKNWLGKTTISPETRGIIYRCEDEAGIQSVNANASLDQNGVPPFSYTASVDGITNYRDSANKIRAIVIVKVENNKYAPELIVSLNATDNLGNKVSKIFVKDIYPYLK